MDIVPGSDDGAEVPRAHDDDLTRGVEQSFDQVYDVVFPIVDDPEIAAEVVRDVFLDSWPALVAPAEPTDRDRRVLRSARTRALNRLIQYDRRDVPVDTEVPISPDRRRPSIALPRHDDGLDEPHQVARAVSAALGARDSSILSLHLRHGFAASDLADELGVVPDDAMPLLNELRERLAEAIGSWHVWRHGQPGCDELRAVLARTGLVEFDATTAKAVRRHADWCGVCAADRQASAETEAPEATFASVPILVAPDVVRSRVFAALRAGGMRISTPALGAGTWGAPVTRASGDDSPTDEAPARPAPAPTHAPGWAGRRALLAIVAIVIVGVLTALVVASL